MITQTKLTQLENSIVPGSIIVTNNINENIHLSPGTNGQILQIVNGIPTYQTLSSLGISNFNNQTGSTQTLSITNTTSA